MSLRTHRYTDADGTEWVGVCWPKPDRAAEWRAVRAFVIKCGGSLLILLAFAVAFEMVPNDMSPARFWIAFFGGCLFLTFLQWRDRKARE